jgi:hypothetical protein
MAFKSILLGSLLLLLTVQFNTQAQTSSTAEDPLVTLLINKGLLTKEDAQAILAAGDVAQQREGLIPDLKLGSGARIKPYGYFKTSVIYDSSSPQGNDFPLPLLATDTGPSDADLFSTSAVDITVNEMDLPGHPRSRVICQECGEGINDGRELNTVDQGILCHSCAFGTYYQTRSEPILRIYEAA